jgi:hypothetical protein
VAILDALREELAPILTADLDSYCQAIAAMFGEVELYSLAGDDSDGWAILLDVDRCPAKALPYLGQLIGVTVPIGMADSDARALIRDRPQWRRGTPARLVEVAQATLTGTKFVNLLERSASAAPSDPAYGLTVVTRTPETPNPAATLAALLQAKPAGIVLLHLVTPSAIVDELTGTIDSLTGTVDSL